jgi:hypothetical protein
LGYKWVWSGFVLDLSVSSATLFLEGGAKGTVASTTVDQEGSKTLTIPLPNLNIGWAF